MIWANFWSCAFIFGKGVPGEFCKEAKRHQDDGPSVTPSRRTAAHPLPRWELAAQLSQDIDAIFSAANMPWSKLWKGTAGLKGEFQHSREKHGSFPTPKPVLKQVHNYCTFTSTYTVCNFLGFKGDLFRWKHQTLTVSCCLTDLAWNVKEREVVWPSAVCVIVYSIS